LIFGQPRKLVYVSDTNRFVGFCQVINRGLSISATITASATIDGDKLVFCFIVRDATNGCLEQNAIVTFTRCDAWALVQNALKQYLSSSSSVSKDREVLVKLLLGMNSN
jgi:hypothetical protein